ncbi:MAG: hypothetical protein U0835_19915 [Isosphaeraceae bacterium]
MNPLDLRLNAVYQIRSAAKIENRNIYYASSVVRTSWAPGDFGQARMAALAWRYGGLPRGERG